MNKPLEFVSCVHVLLYCILLGVPMPTCVLVGFLFYPEGVSFRARAWRIGLTKTYVYNMT